MLGRSFAHIGHKVLLIDADHRRMGLTKRFDLTDKPGLIDSLGRQLSKELYIFPTDTPDCSIMPAGQLANNLLLEQTANGMFTAFMAQLCQEYDMILLDGTPVLPVADARILSRQVEGTILVERTQTSQREDIVNAHNYLSLAGGNLLGIILIGSNGHDNNYYLGTDDARVKSTKR